MTDYTRVYAYFIYVLVFTQSSDSIQLNEFIQASLNNHSIGSSCRELALQTLGKNEFTLMYGSHVFPCPSCIWSTTALHNRQIVI